MAEQHEKALVPQIRFTGFTDPWEQRKLGEVAPLQRGFDLPVSQMISGPYPVVMSNGVGGWHSKYAVKGPGVVTGRSGTIGGLQYIEGDFWPHNTSLWVTSFNGNEPKFIYWLYSSLNLERFGSGSGVPTLNRNDVHDQLIGVPCNIAEQRRIGAFFDRLDSLITLHQRKYDKLCVLKKSMLDKMFPKGGSLYPEIRFAGFTDPWEQRKLGELFVIGGSGGTPSATNASYYGGDIPFLGISDIKNRDITTTAKSITEKGLENSAAWIIPAGSICLAMYASVGKAGINRVSLATSQAFYNMVFEDETLRDFIYTRLEKADTDNEWNPLISTGTQANLNADKVKSFRILLPSSGERRLIAKYFADLDSLITLHQRKLELLRNIKKSMLDKMFV